MTIEAARSEINESRQASWLPSQTFLLDALERFFMVGIFGIFAYVNTTAILRGFDIRVVLQVISESLPIIMIVFRSPSPTLSDRPADWAVGLFGSLFPFLVVMGPADHPLVPLQICLLLVILGMFTQIAAKVVLGTSFGIIAANRGVREVGPYRFVRHPMYAGYTLTHIGFFLASPSPLNGLFYVIAFCLQIMRIRAEERVLRQDPVYRAFVARVPNMLLPGVY